VGRLTDSDVTGWAVSQSRSIDAAAAAFRLLPLAGESAYASSSATRGSVRVTDGASRHRGPTGEGVELGIVGAVLTLTATQVCNFHRDQ
jgi:hypothetical protein